MPFAGWALLFVVERAHQWQSLCSRDWSAKWRGRSVPRAAALGTALAIGWGEGLGFYVQSERAFWGMIFWVYVAHVAVAGVVGMRSARRRSLGAAGSALALLSLLAIVFCRGGEPGSPRASWLGDPILRSGSQGLPPWVPIAAIAAVAAGHAIPCFARGLARVPAGARARTAMIAIAAAVVEWQLVARSIWFPDGAGFADLPDWWDLGAHAHFLLHPLWMAPFLAHVAIDVIRAGRADAPTA